MVERADPWLAALIARAMTHVTYSNGELTHSRMLVFDYMVWVGRRAYDAGRQSAMLELRTATEVAELLGVDRTTVFRRSVARKVGWRIGRDYLYRPEDVEKLRLI